MKTDSVSVYVSSSKERSVQKTPEQGRPRVNTFEVRFRLKHISTPIVQCLSSLG